MFIKTLMFHYKILLKLIARLMVQVNSGRGSVIGISDWHATWILDINYREYKIIIVHVKFGH